MLITADSKANAYIHPNININLIDNTIVRDDSQANPELPKFCMLIPICVDRGMTNTLEIYYPNEPNRFVLAHGTPNPVKYGFGPNVIHQTLASGANIGIYTINLRGADATKANLIVSMKYKVEENAPYTDTQGNPYYITVDEKGNRVYTTDAGTEEAPNTAVTRDVMHVKFVSSYVEACKSWTDVHSAMNNMVSDVEDENGYKTIPWFSVMYRGSTTYGNNVYWSMTPRSSDADGNNYYAITLFDGNATVTTDALLSMDPDAGKKYGANYYIEPNFNKAFSTLRFMTSESSDQILELFNKHLYTRDDVVNGTEPSIAFSSINPFDVNEFGIVMDEGSIDITDAKAFRLYGGADGNMDRDALMESFFKGEILPDLKSVLRYRFSYIPDLGYTDNTKLAIADLVKKRNRMTICTLFIGGLNSFESAVTQRQGEYFEDAPNMRLMPNCQSPMMFDPYCRKTLRYPAGYFDTMALVSHIREHGNPYHPFAGYNCRWTGYLEDTMMYPEEEPKVIEAFAKARINCVMKDDADGGYISDQLMNINFESDQIEMNNAFIISDMLYDVVHLIHVNHLTFNEPSDVVLLKEQVNEFINGRYSYYSASLAINVYRQGTVGRAKSTNIIEITVNLKNIERYTQVNLVLTDA